MCDVVFLKVKIRFLPIKHVYFSKRIDNMKITLSYKVTGEDLCHIFLLTFKITFVDVVA